MMITKSDARKAVRAILRASGELAYVADLLRSDPGDPSVQSYRRVVARLIMAIFDELSMPLYRAHPDLIPEREREIVEAALRRSEREDK